MVAMRLARYASWLEKQLDVEFKRGQHSAYSQLYGGSDFARDPVWKDDSEVLGAEHDADKETFALFVVYYIPVNQWPKSDTASWQSNGDAPEERSQPVPLIKQLPGATHYRMLSRMFHPDNALAGVPSGRRETRATSAQQSQNPAAPPPLAMLEPDYLPVPSGEITALLNAGYDLWKEVLNHPDVQDASFNMELDDNRLEFAERSPAHAALLELYNIWTELMIETTTNITPHGRSLMGIYRATTATGINSVREAYPSDTQNVVADTELASMDISAMKTWVISHCKSFKTREPAPPRGDTQEDDEDDEEEDEEEESEEESEDEEEEDVDA